eukprot:scaffold5048_cov338-Prasinococcus_capsulatus_cf.AAC.4
MYKQRKAGEPDPALRRRGCDVLAASRCLRVYRAPQQPPPTAAPPTVDCVPAPSLAAARQHVPCRAPVPAGVEVEWENRAMGQQRLPYIIPRCVRSTVVPARVPAPRGWRQRHGALRSWRLARSPAPEPRARTAPNLRGHNVDHQRS